MVPLNVHTLIVSRSSLPSVLVMKPVEHLPVHDVSRVLPIWIGLPEATQLGLAMEHVKMPRPLTHDLYIDTITNLDAYVERVVLYESVGQTFYARMVLKHHGRAIEVDARPSDAIALALKQDAKIFVEPHVLDEASFPFITNNPERTETEIKEFLDYVNTLEPDDLENDHGRHGEN